MLAALAASGAAASSSSSGFPEIPKAPAPESISTTAASVSRRRSQRLREKTSGDPTSANPSSEEGHNATEPAAGSSLEGAPEPQPKEFASDTVVNDDDFAAEFSDDDVDFDAEVCWYIFSLVHVLLFF